MGGTWGLFPCRVMAEFSIPLGMELILPEPRIALVQYWQLLLMRSKLETGVKYYLESMIWVESLLICKVKVSVSAAQYGFPLVLAISWYVKFLYGAIWIAKAVFMFEKELVLENN